MPPINLNESRNTVSDSELRSLQSVALAMVVAVVGSAGITAYLSLVSGGTPLTREEVRLLNLLSLLHVVAAGVCYWLAGALFARRLSPKEEDEGPVDPGTSFHRLRATIILRLAMVEAPAWFGVVICLFAGIRGGLAHDPVYWLNFASTLVLVIFAVKTFPSRSRVEYLFNKMGGAPG